MEMTTSVSNMKTKFAFTFPTDEDEVGIRTRARFQKTGLIRGEKQFNMTSSVITKIYIFRENLCDI